MYFKICEDFNKRFLYIPDGMEWSVYNSWLDDNGYEEHCLILEYGDKKTMLHRADDVCQGRPELPDYAFDDFYEEIIDNIYDMLRADPDRKCIDFIEVEEYVMRKYEKIWQERGYIEIDENGAW